MREHLKRYVMRGMEERKVSKMKHAVYRDDVIDMLYSLARADQTQEAETWNKALDEAVDALMRLDVAKPSVASEDKYEYHYDHTDCIWYRPEARNRCPSTCAQYRDGWNDAMQYIFRDGKGYRPYRRDKKYETD